MIDPEIGAPQWNVLLVSGKRSPGVCRLSGPGLVVGWDVKNASGQAGATTTRIGEPIKEFDAEFDLSNALSSPDGVFVDTDEGSVSLQDLGGQISDFDLWDDFQDLLESSVTGKKPVALEVYHPDLARNHITAVTLKSIGMLQHTPGGGGKIKVSFIEFRPPKPVSGKVKQVKTEGDKRIDADLAEIEALQKEWKSL